MFQFISKEVMEKQLKDIMREVEYLKIILVKEDGWIKFKMLNNKNKVISTLRRYVENNFKPSDKFFCSTEKVVDALKSDYRYVMSYRKDCQ